MTTKEEVISVIIDEEDNLVGVIRKKKGVPVVAKCKTATLKEIAEIINSESEMVVKS